MAWCFVSLIVFSSLFSLRPLLLFLYLFLLCGAFLRFLTIFDDFCTISISIYSNFNTHTQENAAIEKGDEVVVNNRAKEQEEAKSLNETKIAEGKS